MATTTARRKTTTEKGLGQRHEQQAKYLHDNHIDGDPCDCCGRPMWRDRTKNYDYKPESTNPHGGKLQADHSKMSRAEAIRRGLPIPLPDRLVHGECNRMRGEGLNDHLLAVNAGSVPDTNDLLMPWPW